MAGWAVAPGRASGAFAGGDHLTGHGAAASGWLCCTSYTTIVHRHRTQAQLVGLQHDQVIASRLLHCRIMHCQALQCEAGTGKGNEEGLSFSTARLAAEVQALGDALPIPPDLQVSPLLILLAVLID